MKTALLIPSYEPSERVLRFLSSFKEGDFDLFLVVDDGSGEKYQHIFEALKEQTVFDVISYPVNKGKGGALKTGMRELIDKNPDLELIVTADSDGQHKYEDILHVKEEAMALDGELVLGVRDFSSENVPFKSKHGNRFSMGYFRLATGKKVSDTQTGLRAIPKALFDLALNTVGRRFEYEMNFLMKAVKEAPLKEVQIETIYEEENKGTHFRPVRDSMRIYKTPLLYLLVSLLSFGIDIGLFTLLSEFVFQENMEQRVFISALIARVTSGIFNFLMFHFVVFNREDRLAHNGLRYFLLWCANYGLSSALTYAFKFLPMALSFVKILVDVFLAIMNYIINLTWTFAKKRRRRRKEKKA